MKKLIKYPFQKIYQFFLWSSGAELDILEQAPVDKNKYFGIGGTIVFTALMASFAGGYAFFTAFKDEVYRTIPATSQIVDGIRETIPELEVFEGYTLTSILLSVFFGLFWGALIFNLDRYIVSSFGVGDGKKTISKQELIEAAPRLVMAIILGFVISTPLELKIFEKEIQTEIERMKIEKKIELGDADSTYTNELTKKEIQLTELENELENLRNNKKLLLTNEVAFIEDRRKEYESDLSQKDGELKLAQNRLNASYNKYFEAKKDTTEKFTEAEIRKRLELYKLNSTQRNVLRKGKEAISDKITDLLNNKEAALKSKEAEIEEEISLAMTRRKGILVKIETLEENIAEQKVTHKDIGENYDGFAAHLEALARVTEKKSIILYAKWLITILFVFIEIAPILFKMMTERGTYDDILDRIKHEAKVKQLLLQSNLNEEVNSAVKLHADKNAQKLSAELESNKELLNSIVKAQSEVAQAAIEEWKKEQIEKVKKDPNSVVKS